MRRKLKCLAQDGSMSLIAIWRTEGLVEALDPGVGFFELGKARLDDCGAIQQGRHST